jgi:CRISPR/Cas system CSM-associated protein Csm5 (group 7 of RAMP superfamily)
MPLTPPGDCENYDLVAARKSEGRHLYIQVKTIAITNDRVTGSASRVRERKKVKYDLDAFDILAIVALDKKRVAFVPRSAFDTAITLRFDLPPSLRTNGIHWFSDFERLT